LQGKKIFSIILITLLVPFSILNNFPQASADINGTTPIDINGTNPAGIQTNQTVTVENQQSIQTNSTVIPSSGSNSGNATSLSQTSSEWKTTPKFFHKF